MALLDQPVIANVLDHLRAAGPNGVRASVLMALLDTQPYPPAIVVLQELVIAGYATASPSAVTTDSIITLTDAGEAELAARVRAGTWICQGTRFTTRKVLVEANILEFLRSVERGQVMLTADADPNEVYAGVVPYSASNGWRIAIFNDCNEWDYIEWIDAEASG